MQIHSVRDALRRDTLWQMKNEMKNPTEKNFNNYEMPVSQNDVLREVLARRLAEVQAIREKANEEIFAIVEGLTFTCGGQRLIKNRTAKVVEIKFEGNERNVIVARADNNETLYLHLIPNV